MKTFKIDLKKMTVDEAIVWNRLLEHNQQVLKALRTNRVNTKHLKRVKL